MTRLRTTMTPSFVVFSGGSACNHIAKAFHHVGQDNVAYILGISDNGGSTSEILRVLGGPSIGDLRSRLTRLIDLIDTCTSNERIAIKELLSYRLSNDPDQVKEEWAAIVEGRHRLWRRIPAEKKESIRGFLTHFNGEILKRAHKRFNFCNGSIGNFFLTGARLFFGSLEAALFLFSAITGISQETKVLPVINTNHMATIAAQLQNGDTIIGQCEISHPSTPSPPHLPYQHLVNPIDAFMQLGDEPMATTHHDHYSLLNADSLSHNLFFSKQVDQQQQLVSPIHRLYYMNEYGQEIYPVPNPKVITQLSTQTTLVYSIGSLYTSIVPSLILRNVGNAIAQSHSLTTKILLLNGSNDRETPDYSAMDFIHTITDALNQSQRIDCRRAFYQTSIAQRLLTTTEGSMSCSSFSSSSCGGDSGYGSFTNSPTQTYPPFPDHLFHPSPPNAFITHLVYLDQGEIPVDVLAIERLGITCIPIKTESCPDTNHPIYNDTILTSALQSICT